MLHWIRYLSTLDSKEMDIKWHVRAKCSSTTGKSSLQLGIYAVKGSKLTSGRYSLYTHTLQISEHFFRITVNPVKAQQFIPLLSTACFGLNPPCRIGYKIIYIYIYIYMCVCVCVCVVYIESRPQNLTICIVMWVHITWVALKNRICIPMLIVLNKAGSRICQYNGK